MHAWMHGCMGGWTDESNDRSGGRSAPKQSGSDRGRLVVGGLRSAGAAALRRRDRLGAELEEARRARPRARRDVEGMIRETGGEAARDRGP